MGRTAVALLLLITSVTAEFDVKFNKHSIDMNPESHIGPLARAMHIEARIGQYLEITCPQYDEGVKNEISLFYVYQFNTNPHSLKKCEVADNPILSCDRPYRTTKLTIKFQKMSPYPLGFTFEEDRTYYYLAVPKGDVGCDNAVTLAVDVKKELNVVVPPMKTIENIPSSTKKLTSTRSTTTTKSTTKKTTLLTKLVNGAQAQSNEGDGNSASTTRHLILMTSLLALLTLWLNA